MTYTDCAFVSAYCKTSGPRQGKDNRLCIVTRERKHRSLLWRVVRVKQPDGKTWITLDDGNGRSAYVSKDKKYVKVAVNKNKLSRALKCSLPKHIGEELKRRAEEWSILSSTEKGLGYCEAYGEDGVVLPIDEVQEAIIFNDDEMGL